MGKQKEVYSRGGQGKIIIRKQQQTRRAWKEIRDKGIVCGICGQPFLRRADVTIDHIYPKSKGGGDCRKNRQYAHSWCNAQKADLIPWPYCRPQDHPWESFTEEVYSIVRRIPRGKVATYKQVAGIMGNPRLAGAVARVLRRTPLEYPVVCNTKAALKRARASGAVPCHRVVGVHGELAEYFGADGVYAHRQRLRREDVTIGDDFVVRLEVYGWRGRARGRH